MFWQWHHWPKPKGTPGIVEAAVVFGGEFIVLGTVAICLWLGSRD